jgi:N-acetyl-anhydromuramyl-L-alanine amidase AmpD
MNPIIQKPSPNYSLRGAFKPEFIIIHAALGTLEGTIATFQRASSQVSAHYMVDRDGSIVQFVQEKYAAWHAMGINPRSIGVEHTDMFKDSTGRLIGGCMGTVPWLTNPQLSQSIELVGSIAVKYQIPLNHILGHSDPWLRQFGNNHQDPGPLFPMNAYLAAIGQYITAHPIVVVQPPALVIPALELAPVTPAVEEHQMHKKGGRPRKVVRS